VKRWPWRRRREGQPSPPPPQGGDETASDPAKVFGALERHGVDYLTIGGVAVQAHGHVRTTADVDVLIENSPENLERAAKALRELGAQLRGVDAELLGIDPRYAETLRDGANFALTTTAGRLDVWTDASELKGARPYAEMRGRAVEATALGLHIPVVALDDLIAMKSAAARPQDLDDIAALTDPLDRPPPGRPPGWGDPSPGSRA
jgi:predicted nucleotidyltransferase